MFKRLGAGLEDDDRKRRMVRYSSVAYDDIGPAVTGNKETM